MLTEEMVKLIELESEKATIEAEIKAKKKIVLQQMVQSNLTDVDHNGLHIRLVEGTRNTIKKEDFALFLNGRQDLAYCMTTELKPDVDMMKLAVASGKMTQSEFDQFVKVSNSTTIKVGK